MLSATVLAASSCFLSKSGPSNAPASWSGDIALQVVNHHWLDVTIYVLHDGQLTRVGVAGGSASTEMILPSRLVGVGRELRLYGDPIGSPERAITEVITVQPGQSIEWLLESELARSTVGVY
jgi:hypothetical protein